MHALIVGSRGVGKSTLIRNVLQKLDRPLFGYETKKEDALADDIQGSPIYIYDAGSIHLQSEENLVGYCKDHHAASLTEAFNRYASKLTASIPSNSIVELDEIGFLESKAACFCDAILTLLDGDTPVIAAVKDKDTPFLQTVRSHPNARCFYITPDNRNELFEEVYQFMKEQLEETQCQEKR